MKTLEVNPCKIIVEGKTDKVFIESLTGKNGIVNSLVEELGGIDDFEYSEKIEEKLKGAKIQVAKGLRKIGIIIDQDAKENNRIIFLNKMIQNVFGTEYALKEEQEPIEIKVGDHIVELSCFIMNVNGEGELSTMLRTIKPENKSSTFADCLEKWWECADAEKKVIDQVEFDKNWYHYYIKWDNSSHKERQQASKYCSLEYSLNHKKDIWNFENEILNNLKKYLSTFSNT
jgi:hypothetical protein